MIPMMKLRISDTDYMEHVCSQIYVQFYEIVNIKDKKVWEFVIRWNYLIIIDQITKIYQNYWVFFLNEQHWPFHYKIYGFVANSNFILIKCFSFIHRELIDKINVNLAIFELAAANGTPLLKQISSATKKLFAGTKVMET